MSLSSQHNHKSSYRANPKRNPKRAFGFTAIVMIAILGVAVYFNTTWHLYWIWLVTLSIITFIMYGFDKGQAKRAGLRVPEIILHGLALSGGFLGGWAGRSLFRHKTQKTIFLIILTVSTIVHLGIIYYLFLS